MSIFKLKYGFFKKYFKSKSFSLVVKSACMLVAMSGRDFSEIKSGWANWLVHHYADTYLEMKFTKRLDRPEQQLWNSCLGGHISRHYTHLLFPQFSGSNMENTLCICHWFMSTRHVFLKA